MIQPTLINNLTAERRNGIIVFADTSGYSTFARRSVESPDLMRQYSLALYNACFRYQNETGGHIKPTGDGMFAFHPYDNDIPVELVDLVLSATIRFYETMVEYDRHMRYPRPDGFRIRVVDGPVWELSAILSRPAECAVNDCERRDIKDYVGSAVIFGARLLEIHRGESLVCCQKIAEIARELPSFALRRLSPHKEKRLPSGIFKEDMMDLWAYNKADNQLRF